MKTKKSKTWIEELENDKGKKYSWEFFIKPTTASRVSKELYLGMYKRNKKKNKKKGGWNYYLINNYFNAWKKRGFLNKERIVTERKIGIITRNYPESRYILNLKPFFEYAKKKKVEFNSIQKGILSFLFFSLNIREYIYKRYKKDENFIKGILKFYFSNFFKHYAFPKIYKLKKYDKKLKKIGKGMGQDFNLTELRWNYVRYPNEKIPWDVTNITTPMTKKEWGSISKKDKIRMNESAKWLERLKKKGVSKSIQENRTFEFPKPVVKDEIFLSAFYFQYKEFHQELSNEMVNLDLKIMKLLNLD